MNYRMLYFFHGRAAVVISHGLSKQQANPEREIALTVKRKRAQAPKSRGAFTNFGTRQASPRRSSPGSSGPAELLSLVSKTTTTAGTHSECFGASPPHWTSVWKFVSCPGGRNSEAAEETCLDYQFWSEATVTHGVRPENSIAPLYQIYASSAPVPCRRRSRCAQYSALGEASAAHSVDRILWSWIARIWPRWRQALVIVQPRTVIAWPRRRFRDHWTKLNRPESQDVQRWPLKSAT